MFRWRKEMWGLHSLRAWRTRRTKVVERVKVGEF